MQPRVFISYSWSSLGHQERVRQWAEQLVGDGVDVVLDLWSFKEGDDKFVFMESMVVDQTITNVLIFSDERYSEKADAREAGVGAESQIISRRVYDAVTHSKFIPIVCEMDDNGEPYLPEFLKSRKWINFSSLEHANSNWEQLIRCLYGQPMHEKPPIGKPPAYLFMSAASPAVPPLSKFSSLKNAMQQQRPGIKGYRQSFLESIYDYVDGIRTKEVIADDDVAQRVLADCRNLKFARDQLLDWVMLESEYTSGDVFEENIMSMLEMLLELKSPPVGLSSYNDSWFEAHSVFTYETFLYVVAALLKAGAYDQVRSVLTNSYLVPQSLYNDSGRMRGFDAFYASSTHLQVLAGEGRRLRAPAAELIKQQADRQDIKFADVIEADLILLLMSFLNENSRWYPQTALYLQRYHPPTFFIRASQHRNFLKLAKVTGVNSADELRAKVKAGHVRTGIKEWRDFSMMHDPAFWDAMNMDALDTMA
ncbi:TIR domain-containing protein [Xanthomonas cannabis]|uniref:SEFIR domain-containing protein n=1 Tax=Xanthomonas cannabis TaxID=1885674 RepID=UPI0033A92F01